MDQKIVVRKIQPGEDEGVWKVAKTLSIFERYYFYYLTYKPSKTDALVAVYGERIVGCVIPGISTLAGEKIGSVDGIFVDRNVQGRGIGKMLLDAALFHFQEAKCKTLYYIVDRFNSSSWNMALHRGFIPFEFNEQFRVFGWKILFLWLAIGYHFEPGTFILRKTVQERQMVREVGERWHFLIAWFVFSLIVLVSVTRLDDPLLSSIPFVLGVVGVSVFAHELSHKLVAHSLGLKTVFKVWESGLVFSFLLALLGIGGYPSYGSTFIKQTDWPYNKKIKEMGLIYSIGPVISLLLASCFLALFYLANIGWPVTLGIVGFWVNFALALFNLIPIFPFTPFDGRKIFLWNKIAWLLLVIWFTLLIMGAIVFL
jgi:Zn-dependent protease